MADTTTWTPISAPTDFQDDAVFEVDFKTKTVQVLVEQPIVAGENLSQFIKFQAPRFYDNIDLTEMMVNILYVSPAGNKGISATVNTEYSDDMIRCGWLVPYAACPQKGTLHFVLEFVGADYTLKTTIASTPVLDSINDEDVVPEPAEQAWYITLQANVSATLQAAQTALGRIESIFNALSTPTAASEASEMLDESTIYVYTGSETGYTYGDWYYYDGTEWVSGGEYASTALTVDSAPTQGSTNAVSSGGVWSNTLNVYQERINADNYQTYGITDIISMPTNKYAAFYTYPDNSKRITPEMVANLPSYEHAFICVLKTSPATNSYASYIAWGFTSSTGVEAVYVANGKGSTSNTPWVKIWDASVNADSIAQKLDVANTSNVSLSFTERINKENVSAYGINSAVSIPANRYITFSTNPGLSTAITESDVSGLPSYSHNFLTVLKLAPVSNPYASYIAWGFSTANGIESVYTANGLGSTSNTPWVKIWEKDNNCEGHFRSSKKVSIIGDSISTFTGYVPSGYATYYPRQDVTSVDKLWWKIALDKTGMQLLKNAAWASSTVVGDDTQGAIVASSDARIADLADGDTKPDIVIVLIGTNDFGRSYSIGTFTDTDTIPTASNIADFKPAYAKMIGKIHTAYPEAKVFACTLIPRTFSGGGYPVKNQNNESLYAYNKAIKDVAEMMNCSVIDINMNSGINVNNLPNHFIQETSGSYIHPLASGQALVGECVARELIKGVTL